MARNRTMMGDQMMGNQFGQDASLIMADVADAANRAAATGQIDAIKREQDIARMQSRAAGQDRRAEKIGEAQDFAFDRSINRRYADIARNERAAAREDANRLLQNRLAAFTGAASTLASQYANYEAQQKALQKGLTLAEQKGGVKGAIDFLNANPDYDPGEETLQRLYAGSEMGQRDAANLADELDTQRVRARGELRKARTNRLFDESLEKENAQFMRMQAAKKLERDVADDMALAALRRADMEAFRQGQANQIAVEALNRQADDFMLRQAANPRGVDIYQTQRDPMGNPIVSPIDDYLLDYTGTPSDNLGFQSASDAVDTSGYEGGRLRGEIAKRRALENLIDRLQYMQMMGL